MLLLVVVSRAKHLRSATILEEDVEDEDEDDVEAKPLAATRRANMNFLMEQKHFGNYLTRFCHASRLVILYTRDMFATRTTTTTTTTSARQHEGVDDARRRRQNGRRRHVGGRRATRKARSVIIRNSSNEDNDDDDGIGNEEERRYALEIKSRASRLRAKSIKQYLGAMGQKSNDCFDKEDLVERLTQSWLERSQRSVRVPLRRAGVQEPTSRVLRGDIKHKHGRR